MKSISFARFRRLAFSIAMQLAFAVATVCPVLADEAKEILLIAGEVTKVDSVGHHDYTAGCKCLKTTLEKTPGVRCRIVENGWPDTESAFDTANGVVFYTDGGGKQAFLKTRERIEKLNSLAASRMGLVMIHQAVDFPDEFEVEGKSWLGGVYLSGKSSRGHWDSSHVDFPSHPVTQGVVPWKINDGWLNGIQFVDGLRGITPLVWSGKEYMGSRAGLDQDIVGWAYLRANEGRSFAFTGLDAHSAWKEIGMRQLMINGILWTAGLKIADSGAACEIEADELDAMLTPREPKKPSKKNSKK